MSVSTSLRAKVPKGLAFGIAEHLLIKSWAAAHHVRATVRLDHGVDDEEYEEAIALHPGDSRQCRLILWRDAEAVFVQPLIGYLRCYDSVFDALEFMLPTRQIILTSITATDWPAPC